MEHYWTLKCILKTPLRRTDRTNKAERGRQSKTAASAVPPATASAIAAVKSTDPAAEAEAEAEAERELVSQFSTCSFKKTLHDAGQHRLHLVEVYTLRDPVPKRGVLEHRAELLSCAHQPLAGRSLRGPEQLHDPGPVVGESLPHSGLALHGVVPNASQQSEAVRGSLSWLGI